MSFVLSVVSLLMQWYVWTPIVLILGYMTWRNYRSIDAVKNIESVLLMLEIPKTNDKSELAAEQMFASLHGILRDAKSTSALKLPRLADAFNSTCGRRRRCKASLKGKSTRNTRKYKFTLPKRITSHTSATTPSSIRRNYH